MAFVMYCTKCKREVSAQKVHGPANGKGHGGGGWWNRCSRCGMHFGAPPPLTERRKARSYTRASGQLLLGGGASR